MDVLTGRSHANQAGRGSNSSAESLLRALVNDEVVDIPTPGPGINNGVGTICKSSSHRRGGIIETTILLDLTGLNSNVVSDIIGVDAAGAAYISQALPTVMGTILGGEMTCLEAPTGGEPDIDLFSAVEATGVEDTAITDLDETAIVTAAADWTIGLKRAFVAVPAANEYLYLVGGGGTTDDTYTAGKFLIRIYGYDA